MRDRSQNMIWRPFYFANLIVDPKNENRVYKPDWASIVSNDGGESFSNIGGGAHGDFHDVWIDPNNTDQLITGDDGGLWYSLRRRQQVVEGRQSAGLAVLSRERRHGPAVQRVRRAAGQQLLGRRVAVSGRHHQQPVGEHVRRRRVLDVRRSDRSGLHLRRIAGRIHRPRQPQDTRDRATSSRCLDTRKASSASTGTRRFTSARRRTGTVYIGAQFLFRSRDFGQTWDRISPDLTTNDPKKQKQEESGGVTVDNSSAEMHTTIYAIAESPKDPNVIWVGTDDGNLQITRDGGKTLDQRRRQHRRAAEECLGVIGRSGPLRSGTVYATFDLHTFGDMRPYALQVDRLRQDAGSLWCLPEAPVRGYAHVIKEDLVNPRSAVPGHGDWTVGLARWRKELGAVQRGRFPAVAVRDLAIHPRDHDLVIATHGRGIWIIDDITPLRALTPAALSTKERRSSKAARSCSGFRRSAAGSNGDAAFVGPNPPDDAVITYYQQKRHIFGDMKMEVFDSGRQAAGHAADGKRRGLSRATWSMRLPAPRVPTAASARRRRTVGSARAPGNLHREDDQGAGGIHHEARPSWPIRGRHTTAEIGRCSSTWRCGCTACSVK